MARSKLPNEIVLMIIEMLGINDASRLCEALNISEELAVIYHKFSSDYDFEHWICDPRKGKVLKPHLAKLLFKNTCFQSTAGSYEKVKHALLTHDIELVKNALVTAFEEDPKLTISMLFPIACSYGNLDVVKLLSENGFHISYPDNEGLAQACRFGYLDIIRFIISDSKFDLSYTYDILRTAVYREDVDVIRVLLADDRMDPTNLLEIAALNGNLEIFKLLLAHPRVLAHPPNCAKGIFLSAVSTGNTEIVKLLLAHPRADPSDQDNQAIIDAASLGNLEIFKLLLQDPRVNPADKKSQAIILAAKNGHLEIVKLLLANTIGNPADQNNQAIRFATFNGHEKTVRLLLSDPRVVNPQMKYLAKRIRKMGIRFDK